MLLISERRSDLREEPEAMLALAVGNVLAGKQHNFAPHEDDEPLGCRALTGEY